MKTEISTYEQQALDFAAKHGVKLRIISSSFGHHFINDNQSRHIFKCELSRNGKKYTFKFGQSIAEGANKPTMYDVLSCLTKYDIGTINDFCAEFGYHLWDEDTFKEDKNTKKTYNAVLKEWHAVEHLFSDVIEELQEIQ